METTFLLRNFCDRGPRGSHVFACLQYAFSLYIGSNSTLCIWFSFVILHSQCSHSLYVYWHLHPWGFLKFLLVALNIWKDVKDPASIMSAYFWHVWLIASLLSANVSIWMTPNFPPQIIVYFQILISGRVEPTTHSMQSQLRSEWGCWDKAGLFSTVLDHSC